MPKTYELQSSKSTNELGAHELTAREEQIMELVAQGYTNVQISIKLAMSYDSVRIEVYRICKKLVTKNRVTAAVKWSLSHVAR